ncbi:hypothetical protein [Ruminococcus sp.]|uniref:hypothetical protein n=1 Tax=Ruminococcus sp. TaxID=41978 RepID=UPI0025FFBF5B|nr:hypothetical protein [Ruminococcus sp.]
MRRIVGNIGCFKMPDGRYGFGRIFQETAVAFYKHIGVSEGDIPQTEDYAFIVGVYDSGVRKMKLVEKRAYSSIEEVTAPSMSIKDPISGEYSIYKEGMIIPSDYEECKELEVCAVWELEHIIDRLLGDNKWTPTINV